MHTHIQSFHFNGSAEEVFAFLRRDGETQQFIAGDYTFVYNVADEPALHSVINVVLNVGLLRVKSEDEADGGLDPGRTPYPCAQLELRLLQSRPGSCQGQLFIVMMDPDAVAASLGLTVDQAGSAIRSFIAGSWRQMIACWEAYKRERGVAVAPLRSRGGRPRHPDDDWAYEQVVVQGRPRPEVYREWLVRIGERARALADPQDSFRRAIAARGMKP